MFSQIIVVTTALLQAEDKVLYLFYWPSPEAGNLF